MNPITQIALPISLAFIMFAMGLGLTPADFTRVVRRPRDFLIGATLQVVALPVVAGLLASVWPLTPELAVGLMLLAACPGGTTSNLLTHLGRGDIALSITLTAVISVAGAVTIPLILGVSLEYFMGAEAPDLPIIGTLSSVFLITTVPVAIGMAVRRWRPLFAAWMEPRSRPLVTVLFVIIVIGAVLSERSLLAEHLDETLLAVVVLNLVMLSIAYGTSRLFDLPQRQRTAITLECGLQNATLAIVVGATMMGNVAFTVPAGLYGLWMFVSAGAFAVRAARTTPEGSA